MPSARRSKADLGERGVLDQLARVARVEHAVEVLAATEVDGLLELLEEQDVVGDRRLVGGEARACRGSRALDTSREPVDQQGPERRCRQDAERRDAPSHRAIGYRIGGIGDNIAFRGPRSVGDASRSPTAARAARSMDPRPIASHSTPLRLSILVGTRPRARARRCVRWGIRFLFGLPSPEVDPLLAALEEHGMRLVPIRHEAAGAHMAEGLYKTTGQVAVVIGCEGLYAESLADVESALAEARAVPGPVVVCVRTNRAANLGVAPEPALRFMEVYQGPT